MATFNSPTYAKNSQLYVGKPIKEISDNLEAADKSYWNNLNNINQLEILAKNVKLSEYDAPLKQEAIQNMQNKLTEIRKSGRFELATALTGDIAKEFATNNKLQNAAQDYQTYQNNLEEIRKADAPSDFKKYAAMTAEKNLKSAAEQRQNGDNPEYAKYNAVDLVKYQDIYEKLASFATNWKANASDMGFTSSVVKDARGVEKTVWKQGDKVYVSEKEVKDALMQMLQNDPKYSSYIKDMARVDSAVNAGIDFDSLPQDKQAGIIKKTMENFADPVAKKESFQQVRMNYEIDKAAEEERLMFIKAGLEQNAVNAMFGVAKTEEIEYSKSTIKDMNKMSTADAIRLSDIKKQLPTVKDPNIKLQLQAEQKAIEKRQYNYLKLQNTMLKDMPQKTKNDITNRINVLFGDKNKKFSEDAAMGIILLAANSSNTFSLTSAEENYLKEVTGMKDSGLISKFFNSETMGALKDYAIIKGIKGYVEDWADENPLSRSALTFTAKNTMSNNKEGAIPSTLANYNENTTKLFQQGSVNFTNIDGEQVSFSTLKDANSSFFSPEIDAANTEIVTTDMVKNGKLYDKLDVKNKNGEVISTMFVQNSNQQDSRANRLATGKALITASTDPTKIKEARLLYASAYSGVGLTSAGDPTIAEGTTVTDLEIVGPKGKEPLVVKTVKENGNKVYYIGYGKDDNFVSKASANTYNELLELTTINHAMAQGENGDIETINLFRKK